MLKKHYKQLLYTNSLDEHVKKKGVRTFLRFYGKTSTVMYFGILLHLLGNSLYNECNILGGVT